MRAAGSSSIQFNMCSKLEHNLRRHTHASEAGAPVEEFAADPLSAFVVSVHVKAIVALLVIVMQVRHCPKLPQTSSKASECAPACCCRRRRRGVLALPAQACAPAGAV